MANKTNYVVPKESNDELSMPNIDKIVDKEVKRLTKELIDDTKELINMGTSYETIEFIEEVDEYKQFNNFMEEQLGSLKITIQSILNKGYSSRQEYDYISYLDLFSVVYNNGVANLTLSIDIPDFNIGETKIVQATKLGSEA
jgi:hypothetical protein